MWEMETQDFDFWSNQRVYKQDNTANCQSSYAFKPEQFKSKLLVVSHRFIPTSDMRM